MTDLPESEPCANGVVVPGMEVVQYNSLAGLFSSPFLRAFPSDLLLHKAQETKSLDGWLAETIVDIGMLELLAYYAISKSWDVSEDIVSL